MNIIDALVVTLGMDSSDFDQGQKKVSDNLGKMSDDAKKVSSSMSAVPEIMYEIYDAVNQLVSNVTGVERLSKSFEDFKKGSKTASSEAKRTGDSVKHLNTQARSMSGTFSSSGDQMARSLRGVTNEMLGLLALSKSGGTLGGIFKNAVDDQASLGRLAQNIGESPRDLRAHENVIKRVGGTAEEARQSISNLYTQLQEGKQTGKIPPWVNALKVSVTNKDGTFRKSEDIIADAAESLQKASPDDRAWYVQQMGLSNSYATLMRDGGKHVHDEFTDARSRVGITNEGVEKVQGLQRQIAIAIENLSGAWDKLVDSISKPIGDFIEKLNASPETEMKIAAVVGIAASAYFARLIRTLTRVLTGAASSAIGNAGAAASAAGKTGGIPLLGKLGLAFGAYEAYQGYDGDRAKDQYGNDSTKSKSYSALDYIASGISFGSITPDEVSGMVKRFDKWVYDKLGWAYDQFGNVVDMSTIPGRPSDPYEHLSYYEQWQLADRQARRKRYADEGLDSKADGLGDTEASDTALMNQHRRALEFDQKWKSIPNQNSTNKEDQQVEKNVIPALAPLLSSLEKQYGLPEGLMSAVAQTESAGNPLARNKKSGAEGLWQLMPATGRELGLKGGEAFDPQKAAPAAARYLKQMLDAFGGDIEQALAAYNWGIGNMQRKGMAQAPKETRDYAPKVLANMPVKMSPQNEQIMRQLADAALSQNATADDMRGWSPADFGVQMGAHMSPPVQNSLNSQDNRSTTSNSTRIDQINVNMTGGNAQDVSNNIGSVLQRHPFIPKGANYA